MNNIQHIVIDRDPQLEMRAVIDSLQHAIERPAHFSRKAIQRLQLARDLVKRSIEEIDQ